MNSRGNWRNHLDWDSDQFIAYSRARLATTLLLLFVVSGIYACDEVRFSLYGRYAVATVVKADKTITGRSGGDELDVRFRYLDPQGMERFDSIFLPLDTPISPGDRFEIIYIPNEKFAILPVFKRRWWALAIFGGVSFAVGLGATVMLLGLLRDVRAMEDKNFQMELEVMVTPESKRMDPR